MPALDAGIHVGPPKPLFRIIFMRRLVDRRVVTFTAGPVSGPTRWPGDDEKRNAFASPGPHIPAVSVSPLTSPQERGN